MLDELIRSNAVDKRWAEALIAGAATLEDLDAPRSAPPTTAGVSLGSTVRACAGIAGDGADLSSPRTTDRADGLD